MPFSSILPIDKTLSGATILSQRGPGSDDNLEVLRIPQSFCMIGTSPSDCFVSYQVIRWDVLPIWKEAVSGMYLCFYVIKNIL